MQVTPATVISPCENDTSQAAILGLLGRFSGEDDVYSDYFKKSLVVQVSNDAVPCSRRVIRVMVKMNAAKVGRASRIKARDEVTDTNLGGNEYEPVRTLFREYKNLYHRNMIFFKTN